jgi:hypothetical protein
MEKGFDVEVKELKTFFQNRPEFAKQYLDKFYETHKK